MLTNHGKQVVMSRLSTGDPIHWVLLLGVAGYAPSLTLDEITEPDIGVGGYNRVDLSTDDPANWPIVGTLDNHVYMESRTVTFAPEGEYSSAVSRVMLASVDVASGELVIDALGSPLPAEVVLSPATELLDRQFKFRLYI